ncbi:sodium:solute symporter family protein, partial [Rickettsia endosymbiont of Cardiosporidium cionae]|uniref:sodium:solute symporter family protein n=1 Tax=Rickettsia endosymbiont of Cardiosporidium cionae TaxID=2777155 RepID=UPI001895BF5F
MESVKISLEFADKLIIIAFIGIICWTGLKNIFTVKTFKFFALGNRNFSTGALVATIVATYMSGSGFFIGLSNKYTSGLYDIVRTSSIYLALIILAFFIVPRMQDFLGNISIAEAMSRIYGVGIRYTISLAIIINAVGMIAVQFKAFGKIFEYFTTISPDMSIVFSALLVTIYSTIGGIKAVVYTDIIQFLTFSIAIIIIGLIILYAADVSEAKILKLTKHKQFNFKEMFDTQDVSFWQTVNLSCFFLVANLINPPTAHRILMASDLTKIRQAVILSVIVLLVALALTSIIPIALFMIDTNLDANNLVTVIVKKYSIFSGIAGILIVGVIAMSMSTADSWINTAAVTFANDLWPSKNPKYQLFVAKSFSFLIGLIALRIALIETSLLDIVKKFASFYTGIVVPVLLLTIFGFRTDKSVILTSMGVGFAFIMLFRVYLPETEPSVIVAIITTSLILGFHYLIFKEGGF